MNKLSFNSSFHKLRLRIIYVIRSWAISPPHSHKSDQQISFLLHKNGFGGIHRTSEPHKIWDIKANPEWEVHEHFKEIL